MVSRPQGRIPGAAYTLAMWEIGELTAAQLKDMRDIAAKDANSQWNNVHTGAQEARQKVLDEFSLREKFFQSK